jgi:hypothetical protein
MGKFVFITLHRMCEIWGFHVLRLNIARHNKNCQIYVNMAVWCRGDRWNRANCLIKAKRVSAKILPEIKVGGLKNKLCSWRGAILVDKLCSWRGAIFVVKDRHKASRQPGVSMHNEKNKSLGLLTSLTSSTGTCFVHLSGKYHVEMRFKVKVCP